MRNAGLREERAGIKNAGRNISNVRYADDTTPMAESEEELKSLLMSVKGIRSQDRNPVVPASTCHEALFHCYQTQWSSERPLPTPQ